MSTKQNARVLFDATRSLREALGETQEEFAARLGWHPVSQARYETSHSPKGKVLIQLERVAIAHNRNDLAETFRKHLLEELDLPGDFSIFTQSLLPHHALKDLNTEEYLQLTVEDFIDIRAAVDAFVEILISHEHEELREKILFLMWEQLRMHQKKPALKEGFLRKIVKDDPLYAPLKRKIQALNRATEKTPDDGKRSKEETPKRKSGLAGAARRRARRKR